MPWSSIQMRPSITGRSRNGYDPIRTPLTENVNVATDKAGVEYLHTMNPQENNKQEHSQVETASHGRIKWDDKINRYVDTQDSHKGDNAWANLVDQNTELCQTCRK